MRQVSNQRPGGARSTRASVLLAIGTCMFLGACASTPQPPNDAIRQAEDAINRAEEARVADYASVNLRTAREKLVQARDLSQAAVSNKDEKAAIKARRLAEQSRSDAELATIKAQEARAKSVNDEIQRNIDALDSALQRTGG